MSDTIKITVSLILLMLVGSGKLLGQQRHDKYALLVGVAKYQDANMNRNPLKFPENDAQALKKLLEDSGYHVDLLVHKSATRKAVSDALKKTAKQGTADGAVLVGFFGHGVQYDQVGYFCPYDTYLRELTDSKGNVIRDKNGAPKQEPDPKSLVSMRVMLDALSACGAKNRILLADCCRDDPNRARGRNAFGSSFQAKDLPPGTAALFACQKGEQAYEHDDWQHGAFTFAFLKHANELASKGPVTSGTLSDKVYVTVRQIVKEKTGRPQQTVYCLNSGRVDFMLKPTAANKMVGQTGKANTEPKKVAPAAKMLEVYQTNHAGAGAELIEQPDNRILLKELFTPKAERIVNGSEVIIEELADCKSGGPLKWAKIRVLNGPAKGKTGWTGMRNLKLTDKKIKSNEAGVMLESKKSQTSAVVQPFRDLLPGFGETSEGWSEVELTNQSFVIKKDDFHAAGDFMLKFTVHSKEKNSILGVNLKGTNTDGVAFRLNHDGKYNWFYQFGGKQPKVPFQSPQCTHYIIKRGRNLELRAEQVSDSTRRDQSPVIGNLVVPEEAEFDGLELAFLSRQVEVPSISLHDLSTPKQPREFTPLNSRMQGTGGEPRGWSTLVSNNQQFTIEKDKLSVHGDFNMEFEVVGKKQGSDFLLKLVGDNCRDVAIGGNMWSSFSDGVTWIFRTPERIDNKKSVVHGRNRYRLTKKGGMMTLEALNAVRTNDPVISRFVVEKDSVFHAVQCTIYSADIGFASVSIKKN